MLFWQYQRILGRRKEDWTLSGCPALPGALQGTQAEKSLESGELTPFSKENPELQGDRCQVIMQTVASGRCQSFVKSERLYLQMLMLCEGLSLLLWSPDGFGQEMNATGAVCLGCVLPIGADV